MPGRAPKPPEQRRNRDVPMRGEWVDLDPVDKKKPILPTLPERSDDQEWHPDTLEAWNDWRLDPATTQYGPAEIRAAIDLARAHHSWRTTEQTSAGAEVRARMTALGLDSKGKRDLRWRAPTEVQAKEHAAAVEAKRTSGGAKVVPIRKRLRAVDPVSK